MLSISQGRRFYDHAQGDLVHNSTQKKADRMDSLADTRECMDALTDN